VRERFLTTLSYWPGSVAARRRELQEALP
jgi:hypothetical protein